MNGKIILISGLSGSGKTTFSNMLSKKFNIPILVSTTTRKRREKEIEGKDYFFVSKEEFLKREMIEYTEYNDNFYGIEKKYFENTLKDTKLAILVVDLTGILRYNKLYPNSFINMLIDIDKKKSYEFLLKRDGEEKAKLRYQHDLSFNFEKHKSHFDIVIKNDKKLNAVKKNIYNEISKYIEE